MTDQKKAAPALRSGGIYTKKKINAATKKRLLEFLTCDEANLSEEDEKIKGGVSYTLTAAFAMAYCYWVML